VIGSGFMGQLVSRTFYLVSVLWFSARGMSVFV
jgi:hypothetical protein